MNKTDQIRMDHAVAEVRARTRALSRHLEEGRPARIASARAGLEKAKEKLEEERRRNAERAKCGGDL